MSLLFALVLLLFALPAWAQPCVQTGPGTAIQNAADNMAADTWCTFATNGINSSTWLDPASVEGHVTTDAARGCYDTLTGNIHYIGAGHIVPTTTTVHHIGYNPTTNTWFVESSPPWGGPGHAAPIHGWNYIACDEKGGMIYRGDLSTNAVHRYNMRTHAWLSDLTIPSNIMGNNVDFMGMTWFPERGSVGRLAFMNLEACHGTSPATGILGEYDPASNTFSIAQTLSGYWDCSSTSYNYSEYSPIHHRIMFGADTTTQTLMDAEGRLANTTAPCSINENRHGLAHADPATGNFVVLCGPTAWYVYNPFTNVWTAKPASTTIPAHIMNATNNDVEPLANIVATPIWDMGVILYVRCTNSGCPMSLYKGGAFGASERDWVHRSHAPGVIRAVGFDSPFDIMERAPTPGCPGTPNTRCPGNRTGLSTTTVDPGRGSLVSSQKTSGASALTFFVPPGGDFDSSYSYFANWRDDVSMKADVGQDRYIQFRVRWDSNMLAGPYATFFKTAMVGGAGDLPTATPSNAINIEQGGTTAYSCSRLEVVWQHIPTRGFPVIYNACPGTRDPNWQVDDRPCIGPNNPAGSGCLSNTDLITQNLAGCTFQSDHSACWHYPANTWVTMTVHIRPSNPYYNETHTYTHNGILEAWVQPDGGTKLKLWDFRPGQDAACDANNGSVNNPACATGLDFNNGMYPLLLFGKTWLLGYSNKANVGAPGVFNSGAQTWYDELIVSTLPIADPGAVAPPVDTTPPTTPGSVTATAISSTQINLAWTQSTDPDNAQNTISYQISRCAGSSCTPSTIIATPTAVSAFGDSGLIPGTTYRYTITAVDPSNNASAASPIVQATTLTDVTAPSVPSTVTATPISANQINLQWTQSTDPDDAQGTLRYNIKRCQGAACTPSSIIQVVTGVGAFSDTTLAASTAYTYALSAMDPAGNTSANSATATATTLAGGAAQFGIQFDGSGSARRMLYWNNPFPIYPATYIFRVLPGRKHVVPSGCPGNPGGLDPGATSPTGYYTTFFWGNNGNFVWNGGSASTYYGMHPYPNIGFPAPTGCGSWEISANGSDPDTGVEVSWDRWHQQVVRVQNNAGQLIHEFYYDWDPANPPTSCVAPVCESFSFFANIPNPPNPAIVIGQAPDICGPPPCSTNTSWGGYPAWEEFKGVIRGIQIYSNILSLTDIQAEITAPQSTTAGNAAIWYLNLNPRPTDVTDKKAGGTVHNGTWACPGIQATCSSVTEWSSGSGTGPSAPTNFHFIP